MSTSEDRELIAQWHPKRGLYFRELRPKRKLCPRCSQIPLDFFIQPGLEGGTGFLNLVTSALSKQHEEVPKVYAAGEHDFSNPANFKHLTYRDITHSAADGCHLCTLVVRSLESGETSAFATADLDGGHVLLTHQVKRFPLTRSKWDAIIPILAQSSHSGPIAAVGLYLRFSIAEAPGEC